MTDDLFFAGIDCGATKVMVQSATLDKRSNRMIPDDLQKEYFYNDHEMWNDAFIPKPVSEQKIEYSDGNIRLTDFEIDQGNIIVETINRAISDVNGHRIGICFPGIKNNDGIVVMANGPRIPDFKKRVKGIDTIYNDSDCCVLGEWRSTIGKLQNTENFVYIGGGTGIADGIVIKGEMIDFNLDHNVKRSWELTMHTGETVESCLSPAGMIGMYNRSTNSNISTMIELSRQKDFINVIDKAKDAFNVLINSRVQFFEENNVEIEKIVIGQRLGLFLKKYDHKLGEIFRGCTTLPIEFSEDRRTAALGAAWSKACL